MNTIAISQYTSFFHDGSIMNIEHLGSNLIFTMGSAEIDREDLKDNIILSSNDRIKGKLHIEKVKTIVINDQLFLGILKQEYDDGEILHLTIKKHFVEITVQWIDFPPKLEKEVFSIIQVQAEKIYWENIPDLPWD